MKVLKGLSIATAMLLLLSGSAAFAADEETGWTSKTDLSWVATSGNSDTSSIGLSSLTTRDWAKSALSIRLDGVKSEATEVDQYFIGDEDNYVSNETTRTLAERYLAELRFQRNISERFFWFVGGGWDRNRPAGIDDRYQGFAGVGNVWVKNERQNWKTDYAISYTDRTDVFDDPTIDNASAGLRLSSLYDIKLGQNSQFGNDTYLNFSFDESDDYWMDMTNYFSVALGANLALKVSLQWLYQNLPAKGLAPIYDMDPDLGGTAIGAGVVTADDLDSIFRTSLVINF